MKQTNKLCCFNLILLCLHSLLLLLLLLCRSLHQLLVFHHLEKDMKAIVFIFSYAFIQAQSEPTFFVFASFFFCNSSMCVSTLFLSRKEWGWGWGWVWGKQASTPTSPMQAITFFPHTHTHISPLICSMRLFTFAVASAVSCFTRTGPTALKTTASLSSKSSSFKIKKKGGGVLWTQFPINAPNSHVNNHSFQKISIKHTFLTISFSLSCATSVWSWTAAFDSSVFNNNNKYIDLIEHKLGIKQQDLSKHWL